MEKYEVGDQFVMTNVWVWAEGEWRKCVGKTFILFSIRTIDFLDNLIVYGLIELSEREVLYL